MHYKKGIIVSILILTGIFTKTAAQKNAGIIPYFKSGGIIYVLLADHNVASRGWAGFGGTREKGENNKETAIREFHEETKDVFKKQNIDKKIKKHKPVKQENFVSFFVEVKYVSVFEITNKKINSKQYRERDLYAWVPLKEIIRAIKSSKNKYQLNSLYLPHESKNNRLYKPFAKAIEKALDENFPEKL